MSIRRGGKATARGWIARILAAAAVVAAVAVPAARPAHAATGTFTRYTDLALPYWVYVPSTYTGSTKVPLVVYLHGCNQSPPDAATGTRLNALAEAQGFIVAYPEQQLGLYPAQTGNVSRCWNFDSPLEWSRTGFEASAIAAITTHVSATWAVDSARTYIAGVSAGGAETSLMLSLYPELYSAGAVLLGCGFPCGDASGLSAYQGMGANRHEMPVFIAAGVGDPLINPAVTEDTTLQWLGTNDYIDDGLYNWTVSPFPASTTNYDFNQTPQPGSGNPCIDPTGPYKLPCAGGIAGFQGSYPYTVQTYNDAAGRDLVDLWWIWGLDHAYPGGDASGSWTDPLGPDITTAFWNFLAAHHR